MNTILTAAQINRLAQRLSDKPLGRSASATTAAERLQRLLAVRIGAERAAATAQVIFAAPGFETAEGRLVAEIECAEDEADVGTMVEAAAPVPVPAIATEASRHSEPAAAPDFSAATHARFRAKLEGLVALAEKGDVPRLRAVVINPVSSSPKAMARYRDLAVMAIEAREGGA